MKQTKSETPDEYRERLLKRITELRMTFVEFMDALPAEVPHKTRSMAIRAFYEMAGVAEGLVTYRVCAGKESGL